MGGRIPQQLVEEIQSRTSILEVVGQYVKLQRRGTRWVGLCPFHQEKSPSFGVSPERGVFHCFGCGASGNSVGFLMRHDGLSFPEAMQKLADRAGVRIERIEDDGDGARRGERERYFRATDFAQNLWETELWSGRHVAARSYLETRGIDEATARAFGLGYAPAGWSNLLDAAVPRGIAVAALDAAGLVITRQNESGQYDRFRDRIMFPVYGLSKQVLAFSGRTLDPAENAKYINSPETTFYTKGRELYGLHAAQRAIQERSRAVLVEGNFDVVSMHARAFPETCAALGTALTEAQARLLMRFTRRVILFYDGDRAGRAAARKAFDVLMEADMPEVLWAQLPDGQDPDDLARTEGTAGIARMLDSARPMLDILVDQIIGPAVGRDVASRTRAAEELGDVLSVVKNRLLREAATEDAARRLGFTSEQLVRAWREKKQVTQRRSFELHPAEETEPTEEPVVAATLSRDHATLLLTLNDQPRLLDSAFREQIALLVDDTRFQSFLTEAAEEYAAGRIRTLQELFDGWDDQGLVKGMYAVLASADAMDAATASRTWDGITRRLKERWVNSELVRVTEALSQAQQIQPDAAVLEALMQRSVSLMKYKKALSTGAGAVQ